MPSILKHIPANTHLFKTLKISPDKTSHCFTQNLLILTYKLTEPQIRLLLYLIIKADSRNYIKIDTNFIKRYIATQLTVKRELQSSVKLWGSNSYNTVKEDIIFLINSLIIIQLKENSSHYLINPVYCYPKIAYSISHIATEFSHEWLDKMINNQLDRKNIKLMAAKYYVVCQAKYDMRNQRKYNKTLSETRRLRELYRHLKSYVAANK